MDIKSHRMEESKVKQSIDELGLNSLFLLSIAWWNFKLKMIGVEGVLWRVGKDCILFEQRELEVLEMLGCAKFEHGYG